MPYAIEYYNMPEYDGPTAEEIATAVLAAMEANPPKVNVALILGATPALFDENDLIDEPLDVNVIQLDGESPAKQLEAR